MGQSPKSKNYTDNPYDYILVQGNADLKNNLVVPRVWTTQVTKRASQGDIILTVRAPVGKVAKTQYDVVLGRGVASIEGNDFFYYLLLNMNKNEFWKKYSTGSTFDSINSSDIKNAIINVPPIKEQNKIGEILDKLEKIITLEQEKKDKIKKVKLYLIQTLFTHDTDYPFLRFQNYFSSWKIKELSKVASITGGGTPSTKIKEYWNGDINWFTPSEIGNTIYVTESERKISKLGLQKSSAKLLPKNRTVLFTSRAGIGSTAILKEDATTNQGFQSLIVDENTDVYFLFSMSETIRKEAIKRSSGSTFLEVSATELGKINIRLPSIDEQEKIGALIHHVDNLIKLKQKKIKNYQRIKNTLLQNLFI